MQAISPNRYTPKAKVKKRIKTFLRKVNDAISSGVMEDAKKAFVEFESELMKGVQNGIYKKNSASRKLTRIAGHIKKMAESK